MSSEQKSETASQERSFAEIIVQYLAILISYRWLIIIGVFLAAVFAVLYSLISLALPSEESPLPNVYVASSVLIMQQEEASSLTSAISSLGITPPEGFGGSSRGFDYASLAIKILQSGAILDTLVDEFDIVEKYGITKSIRSSSREAILNQAEFTYERDTRALTISYQSIDPIFARDVVVRMVELLDEWFSTRGGTSRLKQKKLLEEKLTDVSAEISRLETKVREFQEKHGVMTVDELARSQSQILGDLRSKLMLKEIEIKNYSDFSRIEDPVLARLKSERENLVDQINAIETGFSDSGSSAIPAKSKLPEIALEFNHISTALSIQRKIYEALSQQYEIAKLYVESEPIFQVLEPAEIPDRKAGPSRVKLCTYAVFISFFSSVLLVFIISYFKKLRKKPNILKNLLGRSE